MGLEDAGLLGDGDGGGSEVAVAVVSCSICLEVVIDNGERSWAKLQCGHEFHLDCIGSAFNIKGAMQCPNCRKIEKGQWLYAHGSRPLPDFSFEDWAHDEDLYDLSYSEMSFGLHWCPLTRFPTSFDEGESSSSSYQDFFGPHAVFTEQSPVSSTSHPCPYIAYFGPRSGPTEVPIPYAFRSVDLHYPNWDQTSPFGPDHQHLIPPVARRMARDGPDIPRSGMHPFVNSYSNSNPVGRAPAISTARRSGPHRGGPALVGPIPSADQPGSRRIFQETENSRQDAFHQPLFPPGQPDRDSMWGPFRAPDGGIRSGSFRHGHGSERMPSQNQW